MPFDIKEEMSKIEEQIRENPFITLQDPAKSLRDAWVERETKKAPRRKSIFTDKPGRGTLRAIRNKNLAIRESARRKPPRQIVITYTKTTTKSTHKYVVAPYSFKRRRLKVGWRKMLYAWDMEDKRIKSFALRNIRKVVITDRVFVPKWTIEI